MKEAETLSSIYSKLLMKESRKYMEGKMKKRILIVGLGLIGSSLALCIKRTSSSEIIGFDNQAEATEFAKKTGLIDEIAESLTSGARRAEIIFLCSPVKATLVQLEELNQLSLETALITDVGSTKMEINQLATKLNMKILLVVIQWLVHINPA